MSLFKLLQGCDHTQGRLERRPTPKKEFKLSMPGVGTVLSVSNNPPDYIYRCPVCKTDLPIRENARWEALYRAKLTTPTPPALKRSPSSLQGRPGPKYKREPIGAKLRYDILKRDNFRCVRCGASGKETTLHVDHKVPVSQGGTNDPSNLQTLCEKCNLGKGARRG